MIEIIANIDLEDAVPRLPSNVSQFYEDVIQELLFKLSTTQINIDSETFTVYVTIKARKNVNKSICSKTIQEIKNDLNKLLLQKQLSITIKYLYVITNDLTQNVFKRWVCILCPFIFIPKMLYELAFGVKTKIRLVIAKEEFI